MTNSFDQKFRCRLPLDRHFPDFQTVLCVRPGLTMMIIVRCSIENSSALSDTISLNPFQKENSVTRLMLFSVSACLAGLAGIAAALAQVPTHAQQQAIRSSCVADYKANCSSVPTGGMDALICLEHHEANLSPACRSAVEAVDHGSSGSSPAAVQAAAKPAAEARPAAPAEKPATATAAAPATAEPPHHSAVLAPELSLRQELRIAAGACARDFRLLCPGLPVGHGNVLFCLKVHEPRLDPICKTALEDAGVMF